MGHLCPRCGKEMSYPMEVIEGNHFYNLKVTDVKRGEICQPCAMELWGKFRLVASAKGSHGSQ